MIDRRAMLQGTALGSLLGSVTLQQMEDLFERVGGHPDVVTPQMLREGVGLGSCAADSDAMQMAIETGSPVFLPRLSHPYKFADVQLGLSSTIFAHSLGTGPTPGVAPDLYLVNGDGSAPIFKTEKYGRDKFDRRYITITGISAFNNGAPVIQLHQAPDFRLFNNTLHAIPGAGRATVDVKLSVRGMLKYNRIGGSGTDAWAIQGLDNCNGGDWGSNIVTGGRSGGAVNVGQTQMLSLRNTTIESSLIGFQIAEEDGVCSAIDLSNFYIEQCRDPFRLGLVFALNGVTLDNGYLGNSRTTVIADRNPAFQIGRVRGLHMRGGFFLGSGREDLFRFHNSSSAPFEMENSHIDVGHRRGFSNDVAFDGAFATGKHRLVGNNEIHITPLVAFGTRKEWISTPIACQAGFVSSGVTLPTSYGGQIEAVEIIEASGRLDGTLTLGSPAALGEIVKLDLSRIRLTHGTAKVALSPTARFIRPESALMFSHIAGAAPTTFRVRIVYRN